VYALTPPQFNARGIVAMANAGPDTNKAQFFVAYAKAPHLDGKYTIFGRVIDGADDTLDAMERAPVGAKNRPSPEIRLNKVGWSFSALYAGADAMHTGHRPREPDRRRAAPMTVRLSMYRT
jgi:cyclophilin family peptidyl-prolyl cis-trans isomerase